MPKPADGKEEARQELAVTLETLDEGLLEPGKPLMEGVKVVYLGGSRSESVTLPGHIIVDAVELPEIDPKTGQRKMLTKKTVSDDGHTTIDFATHDVYGRLIDTHLLGDEYGPELKGRRWAVVEHPAHVHALFRRTGPDGRTPAFRVLLTPAQKETMREYIAKAERKRGATEQLFQLTGGVARSAEAA